MQQLIEYPADTLKLDRGMVDVMATPQMLPALQAMIALCHARGMSVVAEGVETQETMDLLITAGCDLFQGYLISRPLPLEELGLWALQRLAETKAEARPALPGPAARRPDRRTRHLVQSGRPHSSRPCRERLQSRAKARRNDTAWMKPETIGSIRTGSQSEGGRPSMRVASRRWP